MLKNFSSQLIKWQREHGRHGLPWQHADAYRVWLSEIMLQQTQVATVIPYYLRFIASFPTIVELAAASEEQVLEHWSGLGYYARGRNLHRAAQIVVALHGGDFPRLYDQILDLPGIGRSTAAAICALAFGERRAILDGNVKRVLARYCGISGPTGVKSVETALWLQAEALLPRQDAAVYTQALMDMGATLCTRSKPRCSHCPVQNSCNAFQTSRVAELPTPRARKILPQRYATFLMVMSDGDILLEKRGSTGVWGGLWCLPQFDDEEAALIWCVQQGIRTEKTDRHSREGGNPADSITPCAAPMPFSHTFTHFKLHITPMLLRLSCRPQSVRQTIWLNLNDAMQAAIPTPVRKLLQDL